MRSFIILAVFMMTALITTSGCDLGKVIGDEAKDGFESVTTDPVSLVDGGNLVAAIRGNDNSKAPGFTIKTKSITGAFTTKYINIALVKLSGTAVTVEYLNSVQMTLTDALEKTITKGNPPEKKYGTWNVPTTPSPDTYYIYVWLTKEQYTGKPTITSGTNPTQFFTELASDKTLIDVSSSGSNKYYATGH